MARVGGASGASERDTLLRRIAELEGEVAGLEGEVAELRSESAAPPSGPSGRRSRAAGAVVVVVIAALLAPLALTASWARGLVTDTDRFLATMAPLADEPAIQQAVTARLTDAILEQIGPDELAGTVTDAIAGIEQLGPRAVGLVGMLQAPLADAISGFVQESVSRIVSSEQFSEAWVAANRAAHEQLVAVMRGDPEAIAQLDDRGNLSVNLASLLAVVLADLSDRGFGLVDRISGLSVSYPLLDNGDVVRLRQLYRFIDLLGPTLIWVTLGLLAAGVALAVNRPRTLMLAGFVLAGSAVVLSLGLTVGRALYTDALVGQLQRLDAGLVVYDQATSGLRPLMRTAAAIGLVLVVVGFAIGGTSAARGLRGLAGRAGQATGPEWLVETRRSPAAGWLRAHRGLVDGTVAVLAGVVLVAADRVTPGLVVTVALVGGALVLLARFLAPAVPAAEDQSQEPSDEVSSSIA